MLHLACSPAVSDTQQKPGELTTEHDQVRNLIKVVGTGFWSAGYVRQHIKEFEKVLLAARSQGRPSRTLVDLRDAAVQSPEVAELLHGAMSRMYEAPERAAIVVPSNLMKMQMKRGFNPVTHAVFISATAAALWLGADVAMADPKDAALQVQAADGSPAETTSRKASNLSIV